MNYLSKRIKCLLHEYANFGTRAFLINYERVAFAFRKQGLVRQ